MRFAVVAAAAAAAACGGSAGAPIRVGGFQPAASTCHDAGVILRGPLADESVGQAKEVMIEQACIDTQWPLAVLDCIASIASPATCLEALDVDQRGAYDRALVTWAERHPDPPDDDPGDAAAVECADALDAVARFPPAEPPGPDYDVVIAWRRAAAQARCDGDDWSPLVRRCLHDGKLATEDCLARLPEESRDRLRADLTATDALLGKAVALRDRTAAIACPRVVAVHYADAAWVGKAPTLAGTERRRAIADSRAQMAKACTDEKWDATVRACIAAADADACFAAPGVSRWPFPALGVFAPTGIAECDAYGRDVIRIASCPSAPPETRATRQDLLESFRESAAAWIDVPATERGLVIDACTHAREALRASSLPCKP